MRPAEHTPDTGTGAPTLRAPSTPQRGDVVVTREPPGVRHTVRQHPANVQFSASARAAAIRLARAFAQAHAVNVWYADKGTSRLLEVYRRVER